MRQSGIAKLTLWVSCLFAPYLVGCTTNRCIAAQDQQEVVAPFPVPATGVYELVLEISEKNIEKLQQENRPYVRAKLGERDGSDSGTVGVKLKGEIGRAHV